MRVSPSESYKRDYHDIITAQGINPELWKWLRAYAAVEDRSVGEIINELIDRHRDHVRRTGTVPQLMSSYELDRENQRSIRGIDRKLWQWLKAQSILENRFLGENLNALIERRKDEVGVV